ncbi:hypothetical protein [Salmonella enterica]|uniref:hypothetical protein n=1 Tax=Salmonella enterica TaxID=28901 RepID=UPI0031B62742
MPIRYVEKLAQVIAKLLPLQLLRGVGWSNGNMSILARESRGGGGQCRSNTGFIWLTRSMPSGNNAWTASCDTTEDQNGSITVYAICPVTIRYHWQTTM